MTDPHEELRTFWDRDADSYDRSPSHAATDPVEAPMWRAALVRHLPPSPATILDVGAGTGAMSLLAAELGYRVTALDLSPGMLGALRKKADDLGIDIETVIGRADQPPQGPFDAVMERHLLWTTPDPVAALRAWHTVAPGGRLVLFEGIFDRVGLAQKARDLASGQVRRMLGISHNHHGEYSPELLRALPLSRATSPLAIVQAVTEAGWRRVRMERLRDVEWARRMASPPVLGWLETVPRFAVVAEA
jgi:ubiquinone/menaquinone biosynthesis C-methylase UbiE